MLRPELIDVFYGLILEVGHFWDAPGRLPWLAMWVVGTFLLGGYLVAPTTRARWLRWAAGVHVAFGVIALAVIVWARARRIDQAVAGGYEALGRTWKVVARDNDLEWGTLYLLGALGVMVVPAWALALSDRWRARLAPERAPVATVCTWGAALVAMICFAATAILIAALDFRGMTHVWESLGAVHDVVRVQMGQFFFVSELLAPIAFMWWVLGVVFVGRVPARERGASNRVIACAAAFCVLGGAARGYALRWHEDIRVYRDPQWTPLWLLDDIEQPQFTRCYTPHSGAQRQHVQPWQLRHGRVVFGRNPPLDDDAVRKRLRDETRELARIWVMPQHIVYADEKHTMREMLPFLRLLYSEGVRQILAVGKVDEERCLNISGKYTVTEPCAVRIKLVEDPDQGVHAIRYETWGRVARLASEHDEGLMLLIEPDLPALRVPLPPQLP